MIRKIIHYVYITDKNTDKVPDKIQRYIDTWKKANPNYEIKLWNGKNFDINSVKWVKQAVGAKKWAFAADYIRLWAVYNYGGIYLDTDVECLKSFDRLLNMKYFLGMNMSRGIVELGIFGAEQECEWIKYLMEYYENNNFILKDGSYSEEPNSHIALKLLKPKFGFLRIPNAENFSATENRIQILPTDFFSPKPWDSEKFITTKNTYTIHHFEKSWDPPTKWYSNIFSKIKYVARKTIGEKRYSNLLWFLSTRKIATHPIIQTPPADT